MKKPFIHFTSGRKKATAAPAPATAPAAAPAAAAVPAPERVRDKTSLQFIIPLVLFYLICGILLIWLDSVVIDVASYVLSVFLGGFGIWLLIRYIRSDTATRVAKTDLALGLGMLFCGIMIAFNPVYLSTVFPAIWALSLIFGGFLKIQFAFDEKCVQINRWWLMLIFAAVSLVIGTLAFLRPAFLGENQNLIIGIMMLAEAVLDVVTFILIHSGMKKMGITPVSAQPAAAPQEGTK